MDHGLYGSPMENAICPVCCSTQDERGRSTVSTTGVVTTTEQLQLIVVLCMLLDSVHTQESRY